MTHHKPPVFRYPGDWVEQAECANEDPSKFYPPDDKPVPRNFYGNAKSVCQRCIVRVECLTYGIDERYGVWGMTTPVERDRIREQRAKRKASRKQHEKPNGPLYRYAMGD